MKTQNSTANTKFWMTLAIMFGIFILLAGTILLIAKPFATDDNEPSNQIVVVQPQTSDNTDNSFDSVKDRVTEVNDNYGQNIKSSYAGSSSTMEAMAKQRMFFSGLKSTLIIILLIAVILLVLIKGFNLTFRKKKKSSDTGESDKTEEVHEKPKSTPKKRQEQPKPAPKKETKEKPKKETKTEEEVADDSDDSSEDEDVQKVTDECQLP